ncbi:MAG: magnesium transporter [Acidilobaceae archaeon]|nr:magnesium transporter [Acidilobaceae archaeon]MDW7973934.1 magnesium transporter [Sulfolobales archaeon]
MRLTALRERLRGAIEIVLGMTLGYALYTVNVFVIALLYPLVEGRKEVIALIPVMNDLRGDIMGSSGARMNTALHLGEASSSMRELLLLEAKPVVALTASTSLLISFLTFFYSRLSGEYLDLEVLQLVGALSSALATAVLLPYLALFAATVFKRGGDPGNVLPTAATIGGDFVSFPLLVLSFLFVSTLPSPLAHVLFLLTISLSISLPIAILITSKRAGRILSERLLVLLAVLLLQPFAGVLLAIFEEELAERALFQISVSFIGIAGALSSVISLRLSVHLHLYGAPGIGNAFLRALLDALFAILPGAFVVSLAGYASAWILGGELAFLDMLVPVTIGLVIAVPVGAFVALFVSLLSFRVGLDPDNVGVPLVTTFMDVLGLLILYFVSTITIS